MLEFNRAFCDFLEYRICEYFRQIEAEELKGFWCDGIVFETMIDNKTALFTAYSGKSGQDKFELLINLGEEFVKRCETSFDVQSCVPNEADTALFTVDTVKKQMYLNI